MNDRGTHATGTALAVLVVLFGFGASACKDSKETSGASTATVPSEAPEQGVRRYFDALAKRDCEAIARTTTGPLRASIDKHGCKKVFEDAEHHGTRLIKILSSSTAGRDPQARLVKIHMFAARDRFVTVRVVPKDGRWVLFNL